jgi:hypothetical protein
MFYVFKVLTVLRIRGQVLFLLSWWLSCYESMLTKFLVFVANNGCYYLWVRMLLNFLFMPIRVALWTSSALCCAMFASLMFSIWKMISIISAVYKGERLMVYINHMFVSLEGAKQWLDWESKNHIWQMLAEFFRWKCWYRVPFLIQLNLLHFMYLIMGNRIYFVKSRLVLKFGRWAQNVMNTATIAVKKLLQ